MLLKQILPSIIFLFGTALCAQTAHWNQLQGDRHYHNKAFKAAEKSYESAGKNTNAIYNMGNAAMQQDKWDMAAEKYMQAASAFTTPQDQSDALFNAGNAYLLLGQYQEAVKAYESSLRKCPNRPDAKKNLQIAKRTIPPPPSTPPPPPPPPPPPKNKYLDQARPFKESTPAPLTPADARRLLETAITPSEDESARQYRKLAPSNRPAKGEKAW